jgi:hypothetical protein
MEIYPLFLSKTKEDLKIEFVFAGNDSDILETGLKDL